MTDREAIEYLNNNSNFSHEGIPYDLAKYNEAKRLAIEALKYRKPEYRHLVKHYKDGIAIYSEECSRCGCEFDHSYDYCPECGQNLYQLSVDDLMMLGCANYLGY